MICGEISQPPARLCSVLNISYLAVVRRSETKLITLNSAAGGRLVRHERRRSDFIGKSVGKEGRMEAEGFQGLVITRQELVQTAAFV